MESCSILFFVEFHSGNFYYCHIYHIIVINITGRILAAIYLFKCTMCPIVALLCFTFISLY